VRLSFVEPSVVQIARDALVRYRDDWDELFAPQFEPPPVPADFAQGNLPQGNWPRIAEHVARAERVSAVVRNEGLEATIARFGDSTHAIEVATVVAAAAQIDEVTFELLRSLLSCEIDELIAYGGFLTLLLDVEGDRERVVSLYEQFCDAVCRMRSSDPGWSERVASVQDGLACLYVQVGRLDDAHELFARRHRDATDLTAALAASRSFLAAGHTGRSMQWLEIGAERADELDRPMMAFKLRKKREALRRRLS